MKILINFSSLIFFFSLLTSAQSADKNNPVITLNADIKPVSDNSYSIEYHVNISGIETSAFMDQKINYPYDASIIEGMILDRKINEKDFLFSERNIDLNGDGDTDDSFPVVYKSNSILINGIRGLPLFRKNSGNYILVPYDSSNRENSIRIKPEGHLLAIHTYEPLAGRIKAMLAESPGGNIFRIFPNSLCIIEIIQNNGEELPDITINNQKPEKSFTNEKSLNPGGENLKRLFTGINLNLKNNSSSGSIRINNIQGNFKVRLKYLFSISNRAVILDEKILVPIRK